MKWWILAIVVLALLALAPTASEQYGAASWRLLKTLLTTIDCSPGETCDLAAGTTIGGVAIETASGGGAPAAADYLTGTAQGGITGEIVVGATPGGELGNTWASPTLDDSLSVDSWTLNDTTLTGATEVDGDANFIPDADTTAATGFDRVYRVLFKNWFNGDSDMNATTKTGVEGIRIEHVVLRKNESGSIEMRTYAGSDADVVSLWMDTFCTQGSRISGNEGCDGIRSALRDYWLSVFGTTAENISSGAATQVIDISNVSNHETKMMGEDAYVWFPALEVQVDVVDAPPGTFNSSGTLEDAGTLWSFDGSATGQGVFTLGAGQVTSSGVKATDWCAAAILSDYLDVSSQAAKLVLPVEAINAGTDTITLGWIGQGYDAHTPYPMLVDEGLAGKEMILAPCAKIDKLTIPVGTEVASEMTITTGANFPAILSGADFQVHAYPNSQEVGMRILMSNQLGTLYPNNGIQAINRLEGSATSGRFQLGSAFRPMFAGSLSNLDDGTNHAFRAGMDCWFKPGSCQFGIDYWAISDPAPVGIVQAAVRQAFDGADWDDDVDRDVVCVYRNTVKQSCITIDKTDGFGDDGDAFRRESQHTSGTATPTDGSTACSTSDQYIETDAHILWICTDGATDDWWGTTLVD